eukprot:842674-Karenia_brevis.AAC.1
MLTAVYPTQWGVALIKSMVKPGKPADATTSLRGIRLLSRMSSWFGRVLDNRLRERWQAGAQQFGFKAH